VFWVYNDNVVYFCPFFWELTFKSKDEFIKSWHSEDFWKNKYSFNFSDSLISFVIG
jgi:hypothetical protein